MTEIDEAYILEAEPKGRKSAGKTPMAAWITVLAAAAVVLIVIGAQRLIRTGAGSSAPSEASTTASDQAMAEVEEAAVEYEEAAPEESGDAKEAFDQAAGEAAEEESAADDYLADAAAEEDADALNTAAASADQGEVAVEPEAAIAEQAAEVYGGNANTFESILKNVCGVEDASEIASVAAEPEGTSGVLKISVTTTDGRTIDSLRYNMTERRFYTTDGAVDVTLSEDEAAAAKGVFGLFN